MYVLWICYGIYHWFQNLLFITCRIVQLNSVTYLHTLLTSNLTIVHASFVSTRKFSKTTCELNAITRMCLEELMTRDACENLHCTPNHLSRILERVIAHETTGHSARHKFSTHRFLKYHHLTRFS